VPRGEILLHPWHGSAPAQAGSITK
jgi:hypothetical protein